jgi:hypothetical protein
VASTASTTTTTTTTTTTAAAAAAAAAVAAAVVPLAFAGAGAVLDYNVETYTTPPTTTTTTPPTTTTTTPPMPLPVLVPSFQRAASISQAPRAVVANLPQL